MPGNISLDSQKNSCLRLYLSPVLFFPLTDAVKVQATQGKRKWILLFTYSQEFF
jgi:hypothetical protein